VSDLLLNELSGKPLLVASRARFSVCVII